MAVDSVAFIPPTPWWSDEGHCPAGVHYFAHDLAYAAGGQMIYMSCDQGKTWVRLKVVQVTNLIGVAGE
jgi:hypothetical protein